VLLVLGKRHDDFASHPSPRTVDRVPAR
jgi:hypothetical protein